MDEAPVTWPEATERVKPMARPPRVCPACRTPLAKSFPQCPACGEPLTPQALDRRTEVR